MKWFVTSNVDVADPFVRDDDTTVEGVVVEPITLKKIEDEYIVAIEDQAKADEIAQTCDTYTDRAPASKLNESPVPDKSQSEWEEILI